MLEENEYIVVIISPYNCQVFSSRFCQDIKRGNTPDVRLNDDPTDPLAKYI